MQRDHFIDFVKGITIINVIIIHTAFHSGGQFPLSLKSLVLLIDVPLFFLCSGITSSGKIKKTIIRLFKTQLSYTLYILILFCLSVLLKYKPSLTLLLENIFHDYKLIPPFFNEYCSIWFLVIFILVSLCGSIILSITTNKKQIDFILAILFLSILYSSFNGQIFGDIINKTTFYLFIFLLGHRLKDIKLNNYQFMFGIITLVVTLFFWYTNANDKLIQNYKFPPTIIYLLMSGFSILTVLFLRTRIKIKSNNLFLYPGRESLFFYFAQGITFSITFSWIVLLDKHAIKWPILFLIASSLNIAITYGIVIFLKFTDTRMWKILKKIPILSSRI